MIQQSERASLNGHIVSGRAYVPELVSPAPISKYLPGIYQLPDPLGRDPYPGQEPFVMRMTAALDLVLAPIFSCLDNVDAYLDPQLAPMDFLEWLGRWVGLVTDENWPLDRRREFVSQASALYRIRGTPRGLATHVQIFTGGEVQILERGGTNWSAEPDGTLPGSLGFDMIVRITVKDPSQIDRGRIDAVVAAAKPAHLIHKIEIVATDSQPTAPSSGEGVVDKEPTDGDGPADEPTVPAS